METLQVKELISRLQSRTWAINTAFNYVITNQWFIFLEQSIPRIGRKWAVTYKTRPFSLINDQNPLSDYTSRFTWKKTWLRWFDVRERATSLAEKALDFSSFVYISQAFIDLLLSLQVLCSKISFRRCCLIFYLLRCFETFCLNKYYNRLLFFRWKLFLCSKIRKK